MLYRRPVPVHRTLLASRCPATHLSKPPSGRSSTACADSDTSHSRIPISRVAPSPTPTARTPHLVASLTNHSRALSGPVQYPLRKQSSSSAYLPPSSASPAPPLSRAAAPPAVVYVPYRQSYRWPVVHRHPYVARRRVARAVAPSAFAIPRRLIVSQITTLTDRIDPTTASPSLRQDLRIAARSLGGVGAVALVAFFLPARRASRTNPAEVLRAG